ncbi:hypothetical protein [Frigoribacterium sp. ME-P-080]|uniref:hypothetical protein n=1 Tax=Frigoribacterium sp. ME-P-080 TaxID=3040289 RepID=UPI002549D415|nr:hypothetical protein [Frigoribacterium sp. ME-P-080]
MFTLDFVKVPAKVVVDPNSVSFMNPDWSVALLEEASQVPVVGERIVAYQPEVDAPDWLGYARVEAVDQVHGLVHFNVDWDNFAEESTPVSAAARLVNASTALVSELLSGPRFPESFAVSGRRFVPSGAVV